METTSGGFTTEQQATSSIAQFLLNTTSTSRDQALIINVVRKYFSDVSTEDFQEFRCEVQASHPQVQKIFKKIIFMLEDKFKLDGQEAIQVLNRLEDNLIKEYQQNHDCSREINQANQITREQIAFDTHELATLIVGNSETERCSYPSQCFGRDLYGFQFVASADVHAF